MEEWDSIGELPAMDAFFDTEGNIVDGPALRDAWARWEEAFPRKASRLSSETRTSKLPRWPKNDPQFSAPDVEKAGAQPWAARTPQRRGFCKRKSQAQRYWHEQNVGRLSFRSDALAASVGCTAAELDAREISPLACDVVFDALSRSQSGITDKLGCDERRASYETAQGGFDADAFEEDLARGRANVAKSYAIYPGSINLVSLFVYYEYERLHDFHVTTDYLSSFVQRFQENLSALS